MSAVLDSKYACKIQPGRIFFRAWLASKLWKFTLSFDVFATDKMTQKVEGRHISQTLSRVIVGPYEVRCFRRMLMCCICYSGEELATRRSSIQSKQKWRLHKT